MKPTDKAIHGMVSESSGRNASEPRSGLVKINPKAETSMVGRRQHVLVSVPSLPPRRSLEMRGHFQGVTVDYLSKSAAGTTLIIGHF